MGSSRGAGGFEKGRKRDRRVDSGIDFDEGALGL